MPVILVLMLLFTLTREGTAQNRKVLLEEFTGAHCGQCPMASYTLDSLMALYPGLIGVSLHTYPVQDAMFFPEIDTIGVQYAPGAPLGSIDRWYYNNGFPYVTQLYTRWDTAVVNRLQVPSPVNIGIAHTWNSSSRLINATVTGTILNNLPVGDYRFGLYVVEDSVTGTGSGYDQSNVYDGLQGNPFYGLGDPILNYVHRHVVRAILSSSWGSAGMILPAPLATQSFSQNFSYVLPSTYNENQVQLVGFMYRFTSSHTGDEVLNAEETPLLPPSSTSWSHPSFPYAAFIQDGQLHIQVAVTGKVEFQLFDVMGREIYSNTFLREYSLPLPAERAVYFFRLMDETGNATSGKIASGN